MTNRPFTTLIQNCHPDPAWAGEGPARLAPTAYQTYRFLRPRSRLFPLRSVKNGLDRDPLAAHPVENDVGSPSDDQLPNPRLDSGSTEIGMNLQSFHHCHEARGQSFRCLRIVQGNVGVNFAEPRARQGRPDDFYRHTASRQKASSSCSLPQTHFGGGNSRSVPQERSQAFMSS